MPQFAAPSMRISPACHGLNDDTRVIPFKCLRGAGADHRHASFSPPLISRHSLRRLVTTFPEATTPNLSTSHLRLFQLSPYAFQQEGIGRQHSLFFSNIRADATLFGNSRYFSRLFIRFTPRPIIYRSFSAGAFSSSLSMALISLSSLKLL